MSAPVTSQAQRTLFMTAIILIPAAICVVLLLRGSVEGAFLNLYLPILLCFPTYYFWKVAFLPPVHVTEAVLLPLGIGIIATRIHRWRWSWPDLGIAVFCLTSGFSDYRHGQHTVAVFDLFGSLVQGFIPYMAGKLLIEQGGLRVETARRFVMCLFVVCIVSGYEYRMGVNPFSLFWQRFFPAELFEWKTQFRWGWGRVSGPYAQSELAGIILFSGVVLTLWLAYHRHWEPKFDLASWLPFRKSTILLGLIAVTLLMTQARGPWIGAMLAIPIAMVGRAKNVRRASKLLGIAALVLGPLLYLGLQQYAGQATVQSGEQQTAQYRQQLLDSYIPTAEAGGAWGWGQDFPRSLGLDSIDNEYLLVMLTQGWVGLSAFCLIAVATVVRLVQAGLGSLNREDGYFAFSLLGIFAGTLFTIFTVYLGNQPYELFFLLAGWSQSLILRKPEDQEVTQAIPAAPRALRHIFT